MKNNSPLRYPGGKAAITPLVEKFVNKQYISAYAEPFSGGAGVALNLLTDKKVPKIILNDKDPAVYSIWKNIIFDTDKFIDAIDKIPVTMSEYEKQKAFFKTCSSPSFDFGLAAFFLNRTNVSGVLTGGPIGGVAQAGKYKIDCRFNKDKLKSKIKAIGDLRDKIELYNEDFEDFIKNHTNPDVFVYIDPPYIDKGRILYKEKMNETAHTKLRDIIDAAVFPWLISYDDCDVIRTLYSKYTIEPVYLNYSAANKGKSKEIIIHE